MPGGAAIGVPTALGTLQRESVAVRMVSVGASRINVSLLVDRADEKRAVKALHLEFFGV